MSRSKYHPIVPGSLEIYCGCMKSGKTRELLNRVDKLNYMNKEENKIIFFKPKIDTRGNTIRSRFGKLSYDCTFVNQEDPYELLDHIKDEKLIAIDEIHFFRKGIEKVIESLLFKEINVIVAGLDLNFRGESFGSMSKLLSMADEVHKLTAVCEYPGCFSPTANRTQRLIDGKPAPYRSKEEIVDGKYENIKYQARCLKHHEVPGKPKLLK